MDLPKFFIDYGVGDYSGMLYKLKAIAQKMMSGEKGVLAEIGNVFDKLLKIKLMTQEGRLLVRSELEAIEKQMAPAVPAAPVTIVAPEPAAPAVAPIDVEKLVDTVAKVALTVPKPAE